METQSKFQLFQKHKIEGRQSIVGGMRATVIRSGSESGHSDTWYDFKEHTKTSNWTNSWGVGDLVVAIAPGPQDPNDPRGWYSPEPGSVDYTLL